MLVVPRLGLVNRLLAGIGGKMLVMSGQEVERYWE